MFSKNEELTLSIDNIGNTGEGIGHVDGYTLFVKDAMPGDVIRAHITKAGKSYGYARLIDIIAPSVDRVVPSCVDSSRCGGCTLQHMSYEKQLEYKEQKVKDCLIRIGGFDAGTIDDITEPIIGTEEPFHYRNKAQFPVGSTKDRSVAIGFYAGRTHSIIDVPECYIQCDESNEAVSIVRSWMEKNHVEPYDETNGTGIIRHILTRVGKNTGDVMVCLVVNKEYDEHAANEKDFVQLVDDLKTIKGLKSFCLNINTKKTNVILGDKIINLYGPGYIEDTIGDVRYRISPLSFYQVNPVQTGKLYSTALEYAEITKNDIVWDLYCGIGTISLFLARKAKRVLGVEIVPQAVRDARINAKINGIDNVTFIEGAAEDIFRQISDGEIQGKTTEDILKPDVIVVDPPRKGCDEKLIETMLDIKPGKIVYISCDPATLARDLKMLCANEYEIKRVRPCDMFPMTGHVETVCCLCKICC